MYSKQQNITILFVFILNNVYFFLSYFHEIYCLKVHLCRAFKINATLFNIFFILPNNIHTSLSIYKCPKNPCCHFIINSSAVGTVWFGKHRKHETGSKSRVAEDNKVFLSLSFFHSSTRLQWDTHYRQQEFTLV